MSSDLSSILFTEVSGPHTNLSSTRGSITLETPKCKLDQNGTEHILSFTARHDASARILTLTTENVVGHFGKCKDHDLNYFYAEILLDIDTSSLLYGSKICYGYNSENSYVDLAINYLIPTDLFDILHDNFQKVFGTFFGLHMFLQTLSAIPAKADQSLSDHYRQCHASLKWLASIATLRKETKITSETNWARVHNVTVVRHYVEEENKENNMTDILIQSIMSAHKHFVKFYVLTDGEDMRPDSYPETDILLIITQRDASEYTLPTSLASFIVKPNFYSAGERCMLALPDLLKKTKANDCPDRKKLLLGQLFDKKDKAKSASGETGASSGCCGGNKSSGPCSSGPCCRDDEKKVEEVKDVAVKKGCCGGSKSSGPCSSGPCSSGPCCRDDEKKEEPKKGCCGKRRVNEQTGTDCTDEKKEENTKPASKCCNEGQAGRCCKEPITNENKETPAKKCCGGKCKKNE